MLSSIGDKYAVFYEPSSAVRDGEATAGDDAVTGLSGEMRDGVYVALRLTPDGPAARAGLQAGDAIVEIDGWQVKRHSTPQEVVSMIRGPVGSTAHFVVRRGSDLLSFDVPRQPAQDVITQTIGSDIAYLRLDRFTGQTPGQVEQALKELLAADPDGLVWDLRYNGGGLMSATQQVLDFFLADGMAFYAEMKDGTLIPYPTRDGDMAEDIPLVVLIGPGTYSAPETVAASIADRSRGLLVGETTHGKGTINSTVSLFDGSMIRITVAEWLSPVHRESFEGRGVPPDVLVGSESISSGDAVLEYAVDYLRRMQD
jgi:carboxyl-terminal processing protease